MPALKDKDRELSDLTEAFWSLRDTMSAMMDTLDILRERLTSLEQTVRDDRMGEALDSLVDAVHGLPGQMEAALRNGLAE